ncbi:MAG: hypothetical protein JWO38_667 [Gemmataceae bacterium]|nr:hypothetical protein [Gemmataceae bacterium]
MVGSVAVLLQAVPPRAVLGHRRTGDARVRPLDREPDGDGLLDRAFGVLLMARQHLIEPRAVLLEFTRAWARLESPESLHLGLNREVCEADPHRPQARGQFLLADVQGEEPQPMPVVFGRGHQVLTLIRGHLDPVQRELCQQVPEVGDPPLQPLNILFQGRSPSE